RHRGRGPPVRYALPDSRPPDRIHTAILQAIQKEGNQASDPGYSVSALKSRSPGKQRVREWGIPVAIAATLVAAGLGWNNYQLQQQVSALQNQITKQSDVIAMLQQPKAQLVALKGMQPTSLASGSMVMTPNKPQAVLVLQNLPVLPEGQYYQIWCIWGQKKLPWSSFSTDDRGRALLKLTLPDNIPVKTLAITVEGTPNPSTPAGPMVMTSAL
ncbi:MAG: anti-sigma factor, partial [Leptolyngbyaceae cyanobacterium bins.59]|nr:anti-sigma factor [Leptolyngbyaceae cyanobacterium bins.59]